MLANHAPSTWHARASSTFVGAKVEWIKVVQLTGPTINREPRALLPQLPRASHVAKCGRQHMYAFLLRMVPEPSACYGLMAFRALQDDDVKGVFSDLFWWLQSADKAVLDARAHMCVCVCVCLRTCGMPGQHLNMCTFKVGKLLMFDNVWSTDWQRKALVNDAA